MKAINLAIAMLFFVLTLSPGTAHAAGRCPQWEARIRKAGLPVKDFSYIAYRESRCSVTAINARYDKHGNVIWTLNKNGSIDRGLFQINSIHKQTVYRVCKGGLHRLLTIDCNLKVAKYLYDSSGLSPWRGQSVVVKPKTTLPPP